VSAPSLDLIRWGRERARTGPWRGDRRIAHLVPLPESAPLSAEFVRRAVTVLSGQGYEKVVTAALAESECEGFFAVGFELAEGLHLLVHDLVDLPVLPEVPGRLRRAWTFDRQAVLALDNLAFSEFWRLDDQGLTDAIQATPRARFRVAVPAGATRPCGYAICGYAGRRGYVQRLAVHPEFQGHGWGRALLLDGLHWLGDRGTRTAVVNTQHGNQTALSLYLHTGFRQQPNGLAVLSIGLPR
jgi:ribosomal protein S18 acetylase RimI-like enzyme